MRPGTLELLRCPYCGGRLELVESLFHRRDADEVQDAILACHCCVFPVVDGIPVMHLHPAATAARDHIQARRPDLARRAMFGLDDESLALQFERVIESDSATYRETVAALGPNFEGGYFLYRFSDPTFVVADAVVRSIAKTVLGGRRRAVDICGGSGHITRSLLEFSSEAPVLADLYFAKAWLARRFTAPGCEPVCCDANSPMPFARGAFDLAVCIDAFMYIWTKRQLVGEMERLLQRGDDLGTVVIGHTHNERTWTPSHGQPLPPEGYAALFETFEPRIFAESRLFDGIVDHATLDLATRDTPAALDAEQALTIVASPHPGVFAHHAIDFSPRAGGEFRLNPLYVAESSGDGHTRLRLSFPDPDYEQEYGACRRYLPDDVVVDSSALDQLPARTAPAALLDLARKRVILDLPRYY